MTTDLITEHLDLWTSAVTYNRGEPELTGIAKLRELILELAVRGKLVPQDPEDEPASELLERIEEEKTRLYKEGKIKKPNVLPEIEEEEKEFELPPGWQWARLGRLFNSVRSGGTPSKSNPSFWGGEIPWASVKDLGAFTEISDSKDHITQEGLKAGSVLADEGDVLICTRMGLGKVAVCKNPIAFNQDLKAIKISSQISERFFLLAFSALEITGTGTTVSGITQNQLLNYVVAIPPKAEQQRIVEKVDELMALCDHLEQRTSDQLSAHETLVDTLLETLTRSQDATELADNWARLAAHFDTLFTTEKSIDRLEQTILQLAVMGRLVPQDPNDEPAAVLLKRIEGEKLQQYKEGFIKKPKSLPEVTKDEKPFDLPAGWCWARIGNVSHLENGDRGKNYPNKSALVSEGIPFVNAGQLDGDLISSDGLQYISRERFDLLRSGKFFDGDILFCLRGSLGKCALVKDFGVGAIASSLVIMRPHAGLEKTYSLKYLKSPVAELMIRRHDNGTAQPNLSGSDFGFFLLPLPPEKEQKRISEKVDELLTLCDRLKTRLNGLGEVQAKLAESLASQAVA